MFKKIGLLFSVAVLSLSLGGCGQWNIFKWAHKEGGSTDTTVLVADGQALLDEGNYTKAVEVFEKAMTSNPRSSEANYGYARAVISASGLGLADLISSVIQQAQTGTSAPLPAGNPFVSFVTRHNALSANLLNFTPSDLARLYDVSKKAITPLKRIADGQTDGVIPADDFDVNFNLAFCLTIHAVCSILDWNGNGIPGEPSVTVGGKVEGDMISVTGNFKVTVAGSSTNDLSTLNTTLSVYSSSKTVIGKLLRQVNTAWNESVDAILNPVPLSPSDYNDNKGALHYLIVSLETISPETAKDLKANIQELATDTNTGIKKLHDDINSYYGGLQAS